MYVLCACYVRAMCVLCACDKRAMCVWCACYVRAMCVPCACLVRAMCLLVRAMWVLCACWKNRYTKCMVMICGSVRVQANTIVVTCLQMDLFKEEENEVKAWHWKQLPEVKKNPIPRDFRLWRCGKCGNKTLTVIRKCLSKDCERFDHKFNTKVVCYVRKILFKWEHFQCSDLRVVCWVHSRQTIR